MEKPLYPSKYMRITQSYNIGTHQNSYAIDEAGQDSSISTFYAPFTGIIKKIYPQDANEVWLESVEPVEYPDGTVDYMTIMFAHSDDVSNLFVGKKINRKEPFYTEGTKGNATGNHCHIECGKGKFTGTGWYKNNNGTYSINNGKKPEECLWVDDTITIINNNNINFKKIQSDVVPTPIDPEEQPVPIEPEPPINPIEPESPTTATIPESSNTGELIYTCVKKDLYGIYLEKDDQLYLKRKK